VLLILGFALALCGGLWLLRRVVGNDGDRGVLDD
jgi:hypothetical protein